IFDVRRQEQSSIVDPERVAWIGEVAELDPRAELILVARKRGIVVVEPRAGTQLPTVVSSDRHLCIRADVAAIEIRIRRRSGRARSALRGKVFMPVRG